MQHRWLCNYSFSSTTNVRLHDAGGAKRGPSPCDPRPRPKVVVNSLSTGRQSARHQATVPWVITDQLNSRHRANLQPIQQPAAATSGPLAAISEAVVTFCEAAAGGVLHSDCVQAGLVAGAGAAVHRASQRNGGLQLCASAHVLSTASSSGCVASSNINVENLLHTLYSSCSSLYPPVSGGSARSAASRPAEATPAATDGPSAPNNGDHPRIQQLDAAASSTGRSDGSGADASSSSRGSDSGGSCSSDVGTLPGEVQGLGGSGGPGGPTGSASNGSSPEEQSRRPLVEEAKAFLLRHFPESADVWKLLRAEDLQRAEHQKAYVALQQHIYGMRFRVEFGNKFNTRNLTRGIAFLDPRPPSHIMLNNHEETPVRAADCTMSVPETISVQDNLLHKHDVVLQHPEWPCVGYKRLNDETSEKRPPPTETDFITYPMEFCSVILGAHGELGRKWACDPWVHVWLEALPGSAQVPSWIAEVLNESYSQQEETIASARAAAVGLTAGAAQAVTGEQDAATEQTMTSGGAGSQPSEASGGALPTCQPVIAASADTLQGSSHPSSDSCSRQAPGSSSGTQLDNLQNPTTTSTAAGPGSSTAAVISSSGRSTLVQTGYRKLLSQLPPSKDQEKDIGRVLNAVCQAIRNIRESNKMEWQVTEVLKAGSFAKKTSLRGSSDLDVVVKIKCHAPFHHCRKKLLTAILQHLCRPSGNGDDDAAKYGWLLGTVPQGCHVHYYIKLEHPILGLQLDIQVAEHCGEKKVQKEVLLGRLLEAAAVLEAGRVAACASSSSSSHQQARSTGGHSNTSSTADGTAPPAVAASVEGRQVARKDVFSDRQRVTNLAELMTDVVTGVHKRCDQRGLPGMGSLITNTIRMMKAWSRFGLPKALAAATAARRASTYSSAAADLATSATADAPMMSAAAASAPAAADAPKGPPGYVWEIFVVYVLEQRLDQGKTYDPGQPLALFLDVLHEASQLLRSSMKKAEAIIVPLYYTREQALMSVFQDEWGENGCPYAPYIISPVDPSYNCNENAAFRDYDALADAAGRLYEQVKSARTVPYDWQWLCQNSTLGPVAEEFAVDA